MYCRYKWKWRICQKDGNFQELLGQRLSRVHYFEKSKDCSQVTSAWIASSEARIYGCEVMQKYSLCWVDLEDKRRRGVLITFHVARALHFLQSYRHFHQAVPSRSRGQALDKSLERSVFLPVAYFSVWVLWSSEVDIYSCTCCCHWRVFCNGCKMRAQHAFCRPFWTWCLRYRWYRWPSCLALIKSDID